MMMTSAVVERITDLFFSNTKISKVKITQETFKKYLMTVEAINQLDWQDTMFQGYQLEEIKVVRMLADLVLPRTITWNCDTDNFECQIQKSEIPVPSDAMLTVSELRKANMAICGAYRLKTSENVTSITEKRIDKKIDDFIGKMINEDGDCIGGADNVYVPVQLKIRTQYRDFKYLVSAEDMIDNWAMITFE